MEQVDGSAPGGDVVGIMTRMRFPQVVQTVTARDAILYALGIGFGAEPSDPAQLRYVFERGLEVFPSMAITLCYPALAGHTLGLDMRQVLHVFQGFELHAPIPLDRPLEGRQVVTGVFDKGRERGVLWTYENRVRDRESGRPICTLKAASMSRVGGGTGAAPRGAPPPAREAPQGPPDAVVDTPLLPQLGLIYRLSGDMNPLHADPEMAREAGFRQPILHGRCTFGVAARALVAACCGGEGSRLHAMEARFRSPVYPGETLRTEIWRDGQGARFRCSVVERDVVVLQGGEARIGERAAEAST